MAIFMGVMGASLNLNNNQLRIEIAKIILKAKFANRIAELAVANILQSA